MLLLLKFNLTIVLYVFELYNKVMRMMNILNDTNTKVGIVT